MKSIYEFLVKQHTSAPQNNDNEWGIPEEYIERLSSGSVKICGKYAIRPGGVRSLWFEIWEYLKKNPDSKMSSVYSQFDLDPKSVGSLIKSLKDAHVIETTGNHTYSAGLVENWNFDKLKR